MKALTTLILTALAFFDFAIVADPADPAIGSLALTNALVVVVAIFALNEKAGK
jgi:hypothetical protein